MTDGLLISMSTCAVFLIKVGENAEENVTKDESTDESKKNQ